MIVAVGSFKDKSMTAITTALQISGDIFSFGMVSRAMAVQLDGWREAYRLSKALQRIVDCETAGANATVKRMAKIADDALGGVYYD
jgi:hypothetical protein